MESPATSPHVPLESPEALLNRELSWLAFARRVLEMAGDASLPLLERVKFVGIHGMLHDEFFMKRMGGLERQAAKNSTKVSPDGRTPAEELSACRFEIRDQMRLLSRLMNDEIRPAMATAGIPILDHAELSDEQRSSIREDFAHSVVPILTPLAVDAEHPFPFISGQGLNMAIQVPDTAGLRERFVRLKVPTNRPRWVPVPGTRGFVPLEQVIAANLDLVLVGNATFRHYLFCVTRDAQGEADEVEEIDEGDSLLPGSIVRQVSRDLKARRFAGISRLKVSSDMPVELQTWLARQLGVTLDDVYSTDTFLGLNDLMSLRVPSGDHLLAPTHEPADHPRLHNESRDGPGSIFEEIRRGDILLHHPYHCFESSVLRFLCDAAEDPAVVAIKLTIYRTNSDSPIIRALTDAARRGKQVAVLVEITARFDEAPNIAWGQLLEREGVHVSYGVEKLKTHVKLALVVRDEAGKLRRYAHVGTGNYHTGTARIYEDLGLLTSDTALCADVALLFNQLTGALPARSYKKLIVAPYDMRSRFIELIRKEAEHALAGRPARIRAKMNQLQDQELIRELYKAGQAGVAISLNVRGLCCLRPGVPGLSENIEVFSVLGRFLEHARIYEFLAGGHPRYFLGSADWMKRNLDRRVESVAPVEDPKLARELSAILDVYDADNATRWDCDADGVYTRRTPAAGQQPASSQAVFLEMAAAERSSAPPRKRVRRARKE
ncbi:MAG: polyphosphate kinase 1 [Candidatus Binatia bacterium]